MLSVIYEELQIIP